MDFLGLTLEDYPELSAPMEVWPDNWRAVCFFEALGKGNWNMGPNGATGIRYEALREVRTALKVRSPEWPDLFEAIRVMEQAALNEIHKDDD